MNLDPARGQRQHADDRLAHDMLAAVGRHGKHVHVSGVTRLHQAGRVYAALTVAKPLDGNIRNRAAGGVTSGGGESEGLADPDFGLCGNHVDAGDRRLRA